jgi:hypothetical protein
MRSCKTPRRSSNRWHARAQARIAGPAMSEPAARIVAGAARAADRIIGYYVLREAAFGSLSLVVLAEPAR